MSELKEFAEALLDQISVETDEEKVIADANAIAFPITGPVAYIPDAIPLSFSLNHVATNLGEPEDAIGPPKLNSPTDKSKDIKDNDNNKDVVVDAEFTDK